MRQSQPWLARCWHRFWPASLSLVRFSGSGTKGLPLEVICSGNRWNVNYLRGLLFANQPSKNNLGRFSLRKLFRSSPAETDCASLLFVPVSLGQFQYFSPTGFLFIPTWLRGEIKLPLTDKVLRRETVKADLRKIRQQEFSYEIARGGAAFREFFHKMNRPYVRAVHGDIAFTDWLAHHRRWLVNYEILFVHRRSEPAKRLAGIVIIYEQTGPRLWTLGVREGCFKEVQNGVVAALYHFSFQHLQTRGFSSVRTGSSRAFLNDGVLKFKQKLANEIIGSYPAGFALKVLKLDAAARNFLLANPFVIQETDGMRAVVFAETLLTADLLLRWLKRYVHPGLAGLRIYTFFEEEKLTSAQLPPELAAQVQIRPAAELLEH